MMFENGNETESNKCPLLATASVKFRKHNNAENMRHFDPKATTAGENRHRRVTAATGPTYRAHRELIQLSRCGDSLLEAP